MMKRIMVLILVVGVLLTQGRAAAQELRFSKVGDSITYSWAYMFDFYHDYDLGPYSYLQTALDAYDPASLLVNPPIAAYPGWTSLDVLLAGNAKVAVCGLTPPLACAYQYEQPDVALIMFGTNDVAQGVSVEAFEANMQEIIDISFDYGVTPVLSTIPDFIGSETHNIEGEDIAPYNAALRQLARVNGVYLIDLWSDLQHLPNKGLSSDGVHPSESPDRKDAYFDADHLQYGFNVLNLGRLKALYHVLPK